MKFEPVRCGEFEGICARNEADRGFAIHVHGLASNFRENDIIEELLSPFYEGGFSVAGVNFPGHDAGHKAENYSDFVPALDAWIDELNVGDNLILQGQSLGTLKTLSYEADARAKYVHKVKAVSLLAPFDDVAVWGSGDKQVQKDRLELMTKITNEQGPETIVDEDWMFWSMSAGLMVQKLTPGSLLDQVATRDGIPTLAWNDIPKFAAAGENDIYTIPTAKDTIELLSKYPNMSAHLIPDADHGFLPNLAGLQDELKKWIDSVL